MPKRKHTMTREEFAAHVYAMHTKNKAFRREQLEVVPWEARLPTRRFEKKEREDLLDRLED